MNKKQIVIWLTCLLLPLNTDLGFLSAQERLPVLILSGKSNHDWKETTPVIEKILSETGMFRPTSTNRPDTLKYSDYKQFRLIIGNWNSWPDTSARWNPEKEQAFERYVREGGGTLFLHAGGSSFYGWPDYHSIAIGRWGKLTRHGPIGDAHVQLTGKDHQILQGLSDFNITDEIWEFTEVHPDATVLAKAHKTGADGKPEPTGHPAILVNNYGKGRCFYTIFGHDAQTLSNPSLRALLVRAAVWASGNQTSFSGSFGTFQYHHDRKPHFHPLISPKGSVLTAESPADHLWHMGFWFSWKYINGLNYWEYTGNPADHVSEGRTNILSVQIDSQPPGSKEILLKIRYHPWESPAEPVMDESQRITVSAPGKDNSYWIDYDCTFKALTEVLLDRTPIPGEPGGQSWGGYSGMSLRLNTGFRDIRFFTASGDSVQNGKSNRWVACEFNNGNGIREQVILFDHPENPRYPSPWYCYNDPATPMFYFSPAVLYNKPLNLRRDEILRLRYRLYLPTEPLNVQQINELQIIAK